MLLNCKISNIYNHLYTLVHIILFICTNQFTEKSILSLNTHIVDEILF